MRLDRWLWCARFYKTRSLAAEAVKAGHVRVGGQRAKPAKEIDLGARLSVSKGADTWAVTVAALPSRRGPAAEAQACYTEDPATLAQRLEQRARRRVEQGRPPTEGRPDKRTRRLIRSNRRRG